MSRAKLVVASLAVAALVAQSAGGAVDAAAAKTPAKTTKTQKQAPVKTLSHLKGVNLSSKSSVKLTNVNILSQGESSVLTYTLTYQNNGSTSISLVDYWTKVKTKSGTVYSVTAITADKDKKKVVPGSTVSVTYTTKIAKSLKYSDLNFQIVKWNFQVAGYEQVLGSINIPAGYAVATPVGSSKNLTLSNLTVNAKVSSVSVIGLGNDNYVNIALNLKNLGAKSLENANLNFVVQTASGTPFALTADSQSTNYTILPQENKNLNLIAKIPKNVNLNGLQLILTQADETAKSDLPVATLGLGTKSGQATTTAPNKEKVLKVENNSISTKIVSVSRNQSFGKSDLSIQFSFTNQGNTVVTLPNYSFAIQVGAKSYPLAASGLEGLTLEPGDEQIISVDGSLPLIANADQMDLILKTAAGAAHTPTDPATPPANSGTSYPVAAYQLPEYTEMQHAIGQEKIVKNNDGTYGVTLDSVQKLPWNDGNLLATKITIANKGAQAAKLPEFAGAYKLDATAVNSTVQVINSNMTQVLGAGEKASVYVVTNVPSSLQFSQMQVQLLRKTGDKTSNWIMFSNYGSTSELKTIADGSYNNLDTAGKKADLMTRKTYLYKGSTNDIIYTELIMRNLEEKQNNLAQLTGYFKTEDGQYYKADVNQVKNTVGPKAATIVSFSAKVPKGTVVSNWDLVVGESITENKFTDGEAKPTGFVNASAMELRLDSRDIKSTLKDVELFPYTLSVTEINGYTNSSGLEVKMKYDLKRDLTFEMGEFQHKFVLEVVDSSGARFEKEVELEKDLLVGGYQTYSLAFSDPIFATSRSGAFQFSIYDSYQGVKTKLATYAVGYDNSNLYR